MTDDSPDSSGNLLRRFPLYVEIGTGLVVLLWVLGSVPIYTCVHTRETVAEDQLKELNKALELYHYEHGRFPARLEALTAPAFGEGCGYSSYLPEDPWKRAYVYLWRPEGDLPYLLFSRGRDGRAGTEDDVHLELKWSSE